MAIKFVILTSGTSWTVPSDWNDADNSIELIGGGGSGGPGITAVHYGAGGGGGEYAKVSNKTYTPGNVITIQIGVGGVATGSGPVSGTATFINNDSNTIIIAQANGGNSGQNSGSGGAGGTGGTGDTLYNGGAGGSGLNIHSGGGGGGAAGPNGVGGAGGNNGSDLGAGGGGNGGGTAGQSPTTGNAGNGGNNFLGSGAGTGGSSGADATAGTVGGGGGGNQASHTLSGKAGGNGVDFADAAHGGGGGGGGGWEATGGNGGLYGGGGGGDGDNDSVAGQGANGIIFITYTPAGNTTTNQTILGQSSIAVKTNQTILGQSDIQVTTDQTIKGQSDIAGTTDQTILGQADIQKFTSQTIEGQSDIRITTNQTILGQSDIPFITDQTLLGQSLITIKTNQTQLGQSSIKITTDQTIEGQSDVTTPTDQTIQGQSFIQKLDSCFTFESLPLGATSGFPGGLAGTAVVTSQTALSGFTRYAKIGQLTWGTASAGAMSAISVVGNFMFLPGNGWGGNLLIFRASDGTNNADIAFVQINLDGTLAMSTDGAGVIAATNLSLHFNRWYWIQASLFFIIQVNPVTLVKEVWVNGGLVYVDGIPAFGGAFGYTGFTYDQIYAATGGLGFNEVIFDQCGNASGFTNFCFLNYSSTPLYPNPGFPNVPPPTPNIRMRVANAFTEFSRQTTKGDMIVAQGFTELAAKPTTSNMKVAQGFIELAMVVTPPTPQPPPPVPTNPPTGRGSEFVSQGRCGPPQIVPTIIPTIPDPPISGIPNPPPPSSPARYCYAQLPGPPFNTN